MCTLVIQPVLLLVSLLYQGEISVLGDVVPPSPHLQYSRQKTLKNVTTIWAVAMWVLKEGGREIEVKSSCPLSNSRAIEVRSFEITLDSL